MNSQIENYMQGSANFQKQLRSAADKSASGRTLSDKLRGKNAESLYAITKHVVDGEMMLPAAARSRGYDAMILDNSSESSADESEEEDTNAELDDPDSREEAIHHSLVGQGAVIVDNEVALVHNFFGQRADDVIVCVSNKVLVIY